MYSYCCVYVFLLLYMFRSGYCFILLLCVLFRCKCVLCYSHRESIQLQLTNTPIPIGNTQVDTSWNVMAHAQKTDFVFRRNVRVHLNRRWRQFSRLLAAEVCASAVVTLDTPCSEVVWRVLATHSTRRFPPSLPLPCVTVCHHVSTGVYAAIWVTIHQSTLRNSPEERTSHCHRKRRLKSRIFLCATTISVVRGLWRWMT